MCFKNGEMSVSFIFLLKNNTGLLFNAKQSIIQSDMIWKLI